MKATLVEVIPKLILSLLIFLTAAGALDAQSFPLAITDRSLMNPEVLHARN